MNEPQQTRAQQIEARRASRQDRSGSSATSGDTTGRESGTAGGAAEGSGPQRPTASMGDSPSPWAAVALEVVQADFGAICTALRLTTEEREWVLEELQVEDE